MKLMWHKSPNSGAVRSINEGRRDCCGLLGWSFFEWDLIEEPNVVFNREKPDIYFADCSTEFELPNYILNKQCKILCSVAQHPEYNEYLFPTLKDQGYYTTDNQIKWVTKLKPDLLYHSASQAAINLGWSGWQKYGWYVKSIPLAGNPIKYNNVVTWENRINDIIYIGDWWKYKDVGLWSFVIPCTGYALTYIAGNGWPINIKDRFLNSEACNEVWNHSKISISVQEPHVRWNPSGFKGGEISERVFSSTLCGCLVIADCPDAIKQVFDLDAIYFPAYDNPDEFHYNIKDILNRKNEDWIEDLRTKQYDIIKNKHTYCNRLLDIYRYLYGTDYCSKSAIDFIVRRDSWKHI